MLAPQYTGRRSFVAAVFTNFAASFGECALHAARTTSRIGIRVIGVIGNIRLH